MALALTLGACADHTREPAANVNRDKVWVLDGDPAHLPDAVARYVSCLRGAGIKVVFPRAATVFGSNLDQSRVAPDSRELRDVLWWRHRHPTETARRIARNCE